MTSDQLQSLRIHLKAGVSAYLVLGIPFAVLTIGFLILQMKKPATNSWQGALVSCLACVVWLIWVEGFKITIANGKIDYRNGLYRHQQIHLQEVSTIKTVWIQWPLLGPTFRVPRIVIGTRKDSNPIAINPKPFSCISLDILKRTIEKVIQG